MQYAMIVEKGEKNYSAYFPDLPGASRPKGWMNVSRLCVKRSNCIRAACVKMDCPSRSQAWLSMSKLYRS